MRAFAGCLILLLAPAADAQVAGEASSDTARAPAGTTVAGTVTDSLSRTPLEGATVQLVNATSGPMFARTAVSDRSGAFTLAGVPAGRYWMGFLHPVLDSLGLEPQQREVYVANRPVRVDLAIPSGARIREGICGPPPSADSGALVLGTVRSAIDRLPVEGATVSGEWLELSFGTGGISRNVSRTVATTGETGWFALCNVPRGGIMELVAARGDDSTTVIEVQIPPDGFLRRDLYFGSLGQVATSSVPAARRDSLPAAPAAGPATTARLSGTVVSAADAYPIGGVQVRIIDGPETVSNQRGEWTLVGVPLGTQMLDIRAVGFYPERRPVDVVEGARPIHVPLSTLKAVLDTVMVTASRYARGRGGFENRRRTGMGRYLTSDDIAERNPTRTSDVFRTMPGIQLEHDAGDMENRILMRALFHNRCSPAIYLDGHYMGALSADDVDAYVRPEHVMGIEIYAGSMIPAEYQQGFNRCGSIVIWTK